MQRRPKSELLLTLEKACRSHTDRERAEARLRGDGEATRGRGGQGRRRSSRAEQRPTAPGDVCIECLAVPQTGRRLRNEPGAGEAGSGEAVCGGLTAVRAEGSTERAKGPLGNRRAPHWTAVSCPPWSPPPPGTYATFHVFLANTRVQVRMC